VRLGWRAILGHVPDLRQSPHPRATANRKDRDVGRGGTACAALPALLHHGRMDRRAVPGHRDHVSSRDHQKQPNNPNLLPFQRREAPFIADDRLNQPSKKPAFPLSLTSPCDKKHPFVTFDFHDDSTGQKKEPENSSKFISFDNQNP
jgi:hypothetical protein